MLIPRVEDVRGALRGVIDPELGDNIVDLGMVRDITVAEDGAVAVHVALTVAGCPLRTQIRDDVVAHVRDVPGVTTVVVPMGEMTSAEKAALMDRARSKAQEKAPTTDIPASAKVVAIASGKGGVGKSSVTANLAAALAARGLTVGVLDADIWGFSIPRMLGIEGTIEVEVDGPGGADGMDDLYKADGVDGATAPARPKMRPLEKRVGAGTLKVLSMGFLAGEDEAIMWRGLMLNRALQHFLEDSRWGELDYLLIDMPPGTGDVQMGLARMLPRAEMLIVTTPALAAQKVAARAADMARKGHLRVAGVIENMSAFICDHGERYALFGSGGGQRLADEVRVPLLASIPLDPSVAAGGDVGAPASLSTTGSVAEVFAALAERIVTDAIPLVEMSGCTGRMLQAIEDALGEKQPVSS